jgi:hypothetical protein
VFFSGLGRSASVPVGAAVGEAFEIRASFSAYGPSEASRNDSWDDLVVISVAVAIAARMLGFAVASLLVEMLDWPSRRRNVPSRSRASGATRLVEESGRRPGVALAVKKAQGARLGRPRALPEATRLRIAARTDLIYGHQAWWLPSVEPALPAHGAAGWAKHAPPLVAGAAAHQLRTRAFVSDRSAKSRSGQAGCCGLGGRSLPSRRP